MLFGSGIVGFIITLVVICAVFFLLKWIVDSAPFIPANFKAIIDWVLIVLCALWLIDVLLGLTGHPVSLRG